jgi:Ca2+-binding EF-hand superfamily protein
MSNKTFPLFFQDSGTVDFEEFICMMSKFRKVKTSNELDDELLEIFKVNISIKL